MKKANWITVGIQGLGFVGSAMAAAVADARNSDCKPYFTVIGVDLPTQDGLRKIEAINEGRLAFEVQDKKLVTALQRANKTGNLSATADVDVYSRASIIVVDVQLDVNYGNKKASLSLDGFKSAIRTLGQKIPAGCLVIIETTVPPGTCERIVAPELASAFRNRGLPENAFLLAHSYERVMPGKEYYDSIVNFWRVYAGYTEEAADACEDFLSKVINVDEYPLTKLSSTTASEIGKVLENSYRATNIAFIEEWSRFAENVGVDLFEVISAVRKRPTHSNIRQPGFGVGGYCLTKDPLLAKLSAKELYGLDNSDFPFSTMAISTNKKMPLICLDKIKMMLDGELNGKSILLLGVSYRQDVGDTRYSPSQVFVQKAQELGANTICHDPLVGFWPEMEMSLEDELPCLSVIDAVVLAVQHEQYKKIDYTAMLNGTKPIFFDACNVLNKEQRDSLRNAGCKVSTIGRGEGL